MQQGAKKSRAAAFAPGTFDNFFTQWVIFLEYCIYFKLVALPASGEVLTGFVQFMSTRLRAHQSLQGYLSGVKKLHLFLKQSIKGFKDSMLELTMKGLQRTNKHITKRAHAMSPAILERIHSQLNMDKPEDAVFWCACIIAFFLMFRKSNLVPDTKYGFNPDKQLKRSDLVYTGHNVIAGIRWAKNQQFSRDLMTFPLPILQSSVICPWRAIKNVFRLIPAPPDAHLFQLPGGASLTYRMFQTKLRLVLREAGVEFPGDYSSHSFRRGGTTFAFLCGVPAEMIKTLGNWRSDAYLKYLEFPLEARLAASELMKIRIMHNNYDY